jgi:TPR repeat protein
MARGYVAAAEVLDKGRGVERDPEAAADYLLKAAPSDDGDAIIELTADAATWSPETIRAVQERLYNAGYYEGAIDAKSGPLFAAALQQWRLLGAPSES